ncbi:MAG: orotidine-5'-phosphate decarboxylase [Thermodesulfobacteriota bacterium]|nr:orotidine-5'-phosphate decarboxylase [Thermodesulfobacteriota bacterium]
MKHPKTAKDYLVFALDVPTLTEAEQYVRLLGDHVGMFKVGLELFIREGRPVIDLIQETTPAGVFLDLKLYDIPATVSRAMKNIAGMGVALTTVHCAGQKDMLKAARDAAGDAVGILGVTVLTSISANDIEEAGFSEEFFRDISRLVSKRAAMAAECGFAGIVCSPLEARSVKQQFGQQFLAVTPGVRPDRGGIAGDDQQRVLTPQAAVQNGSDYLVIGRPIRDADDPRAMADQICQQIRAGMDAVAS